MAYVQEYTDIYIYYQKRQYNRIFRDDSMLKTAVNIDIRLFDEKNGD